MLLPGIILTLVFKYGSMFGNRQVDVASAVNLAKAVVTLVLMGGTYYAPSSRIFPF